MKQRIILVAVFILILITSCNPTFSVGLEHSSSNTPQPVSAATDAQSATAVLSSTNTPIPVTATTLPPTTTITAVIRRKDPTTSLALVPAIVPSTNPTPPVYTDDRSSPSQVIVSLYNAINRKEYLRAYSYWRNPSSSQGSFASFTEGYKNTVSVSIVIGQITGDAGAGQYYFTVPVALKAVNQDGTHSNYSACYIVHQAQPANFGEPPFEPMAIDQGSAVPSALNADDGRVLAAACNGYPTGGSRVDQSVHNLNIDKSNFLDNRSGPIETVSSFLNALNLKQYVRAYYYFQNPTTYPGPFDPYAVGYADTDVITATFGPVQSEGAAGSLYHKVPVAMKVRTTTNTMQTFVGCYTLRLGQPAVQATPPFQPMGIVAGEFSQVTNGINDIPLLATACK